MKDNVRMFQNTTCLHVSTRVSKILLDRYVYNVLKLKVKVKVYLRQGCESHWTLKFEMLTFC